MKVRPLASYFVILVVLVMLPLCAVSFRAQETAPPQPQPKLIRLDPAAKDYLRVLGGPPETVRLRSGMVVLAPGKSVGKHSTEHYEELVVVLAGEGEMVFADGAKLRLQADSAVYCPPATEHDVTNTGTGPLRYLYVVADTR